MKVEMSKLKINFKVQVPVVINYKGHQINKTLRTDLIVEDLVIVELKSVSSLQPIHEAQLLTYLKLFKKPKGLLINFNSTNISKSTRSMVTSYYDKLDQCF